MDTHRGMGMDTLWGISIGNAYEAASINSEYFRVVVGVYE